METKTIPTVVFTAATRERLLALIKEHFNTSEKVAIKTDGNIYSVHLGENKKALAGYHVRIYRGRYQFMKEL